MLEAHTGVKSSRAKAPMARPAVSKRTIIQKKPRNPMRRLATSTNRPAEFLNVERVKMALSDRSVSSETEREIIKFMLSECINGHFFGVDCSRRVFLHNIGFDADDPETITVTRDVKRSDDAPDAWPLQISMVASTTGVGSVAYWVLASDGTFTPLSNREFPMTCHETDLAVDVICASVDRVRVSRQASLPTPQGGEDSPDGDEEEDQNLDGF